MRRKPLQSTNCHLCHRPLAGRSETELAGQLQGACRGCGRAPAQGSFDDTRTSLDPFERRTEAEERYR